MILCGDCGVGGDQGFQRVRHGSNKIRREGVTEHVRHEDLSGAGNPSPGGDHDVERHVRHNGPVGVQEQPWMGNSGQMMSVIYRKSVGLTCKEREAVAEWKRIVGRDETEEQQRYRHQES